MFFSPIGDYFMFALAWFCNFLMWKNGENHIFSGDSVAITLEEMRGFILFQSMNITLNDSCF